MPNHPQLLVSVIIPVHNGGDSFRKCLSSLADAAPHPYEILVVADGESDGSWRLAEKFGAKVLKVPTCGGPARARNLGAQAAQGDILYFIDADVTICPDAISQVANAFTQEPDIAALIGSYDDAPGASNFLSQYKNLFHHYTHQIASEEASTFWGACGAIRREIFFSLGGFDESYYRPCVEDIELGYRLKRAGHKIRLCKDLQVKHLKHWKPVSLLRAEIFYRALPWTELILRDRKFINANDLNLKLSSRLSVMLTFAILSALVESLWWSGFLAIAGVLSLILLAINAPVYQFFLQKRGLRFTLQVIPWHWFYFLYSGLSFVIGTASYHSRQWLSPSANLSLAFRK
ncbi:glycosyltransferase family 2 protein [Microcoleus sp. FACHB-SPT15]|uniref:glycosyltransferase n=1 Tax=Microcoleus sp. FACHB-SPT15 TaxID=2692830 RepID=UPI00177C2B0C|nr:glycosyltransferase family 2 protein [Microcoleus sp. FACHB-SPT15]MBD1804921.1 glycosyltransferase family 2 protein [Microcoleus sp. FACHB-SPT15]